MVKKWIFEAKCSRRNSMGNGKWGPSIGFGFRVLNLTPFTFSEKKITRIHFPLFRIICQRVSRSTALMASLSQKWTCPPQASMEGAAAMQEPEQQQARHSSESD